MGQLLDNTKKMTKIEKKIEKFIFGSELSEANNEPNLRWHQKNWQKNQEKKSKNDFWLRIVWSENWEWQKTEKKEIENLFLGQNCLKRIMS